MAHHLQRRCYEEKANSAASDQGRCLTIEWTADLPYRPSDARYQYAPAKSANLIPLPSCMLSPIHGDGRVWIMKKARLITGMTAAIPAAVGGFAAPAAAHTTQATTAQVQQRPATGKTVVHHGIRPTYGQWWPLSHSDTLYLRSGGSTVLPDQDQVFVTCYYSGTVYFGDKYWDHIIRYFVPPHFEVSKTGHLRDRWVHLPNAESPKAAGIPHC